MMVFSSAGVYISRRLIMPKRSRRGEASMPALVVAPMSVNFFKGKRILRAEGPFPTMISSAKSSIAEYSVSSTLRLKRWISSMNSTSFSLRLVKMAARSPERSIAGPLVSLMETPSSAAMMCASVVLPSPGGPYKSTWSSASPRLLAAAMYTARFSFTFSCPT